MLKVVGWLFVVAGALLIVTIFLAGLGIPMVAFGVAILVAVSLVDRHAQHALGREELSRASRGAVSSIQKPSRERTVVNSMFGR
jgi:hypothetical protein